jgi:hypothetical protein
MYSSNDELIQEVKRRLMQMKKKKNRVYQNPSNYREVKILTTLIPRGNSESRRSSLLKNAQNFMEENNLNLRLIPFIKTTKALIKRLNNNNSHNTKIVNTDIYITDHSRNTKIMHSKKKRIDSNSNILSTSNSFGKCKIISKKHLFLSPYKVMQNRTKLFKNMVNMSKELHSPIRRENDLNKENFKIRSVPRRNTTTNNHIKHKKNEYYGIFPQMYITEKLKIKKSILNEVQKDKTKIIDKSKENKYIKNIKLMYKRLDCENNIIKNIMKNSVHHQRRPNCYFNKFHLDKMHKIIEKYSFQNAE